MNAEHTRRNLRITGSGGSGGGLFKDVRVVGDGQFNGDIDCLSFRSSGTAKVYGKLTAVSCFVNGTLDVSGSLDTKNTRINGRMEVDGDLKAQEIVSRGETCIRGSVKGELTYLKGFFDIGGHCDAEQLRMKGLFRVGGLLNAGTVELAMHSRCVVKEIGGETIDIRRANGNVLKKLIGSLFLPSDFYEGTLHADSIEGDYIYIEHTTADVVRGGNVAIGPGCTIGKVEYTGRFENGFGSVVAELVHN